MTQLRGYIAPHEVYDANGETTGENHFSAYVEDRESDSREFSPEFNDLDDAIAWACERTTFAIARDVGTDYFWVGSEDRPPDIPTRANVRLLD
jgi:hypothetical protein